MTEWWKKQEITSQVRLWDR